ncbi:MAG: leucyl/phenylalanyl-tRNA--protein transferase [Gammaproteobacteria bacterium]|nr:leucyl/phenylalanyl-tRNA--protein transferase [Gammaproteobacteria bacterium]
MLYLLDPDDPNAPFPPLVNAEEEPNGLLAVGGDLTSERLLNAYRHGVFPWYSKGQPILWWSPNPRMVLFPNQLHISRTLKKSLSNRNFRITFGRAFDQVITACAAPRDYESGTWISSDMHAAYTQLHQLGFAHSVEVWLEDKLVGGLYGIAIGKVFFGESMFSRETDASKVALVHLCNKLEAMGYALIDCQVYSEHLNSLGAELIPRTEFKTLLDQWCNEEKPTACWGDD